MKIERETVQMALEYLESGVTHYNKKIEITAALREALAQPEPEPVAWIDKFGNVFPLAAMRGPAWDREPWKPLYLAPPAPEYKETLK